MPRGETGIGRARRLAERHGRRVVLDISGALEAKRMRGIEEAIRQRADMQRARERCSERAASGCLLLFFCRGGAQELAKRSDATQMFRG